MLLCFGLRVLLLILEPIMRILPPSELTMDHELVTLRAKVYQVPHPSSGKLTEWLSLNLDTI